MLTTVDRNPCIRTPNFRAFYPASKEHVSKQLSEIAKYARAVANALEKGGSTVRAGGQLLKIFNEGLFEGTIKCIGNSSSQTIGGTQQLLDAGLVRHELPRLLRAGELPIALKDDLRMLAAVAESARPETDAHSGRPRDQRAHVLGDLLARA